MIAIVILPAAFIIGVLVGMAALLRFGIAREESRRSLRGNPGTRSAAATRQVLGLYASPPRIVLHPSNPADPAEAMPSRNPRTLPWQEAPAQLPAGHPSRYQGGL